MSGVTFFTLGYGDVVPHTRAARLVAVIEAGTGIGFIAVVIGYLPVLYQLFSRREAHVIQLDARAGSPPTAGTMLARHAEGGGLGKLDELLREWEVWGGRAAGEPPLLSDAGVLPLAARQPVLAGGADRHHGHLRADPGRHATRSPPLQARMTFAMARQVVVEMARSLAVTPSRFDGGDRLPPAEFERLGADR